MKTAFQKKAYSILTALVLLLTACTGAVFSSSRAAALELEGTGKADNPYLLSTAAELLEFAEKAAADPDGGYFAGGRNLDTDWLLCRHF